MRLDLHAIINVPGRIPFMYEKDLSDLHFDSVKAFLSPLSGPGEVRNSAGVLTLHAELAARLLCICDRCGSEYEREKQLTVEAVLSDTLQDVDNPDIYLLDGDFLDLDEVLMTEFILDMETKSLCRDDCLGRCAQCGKNLNEGPCGCKSAADPRLAVLGQLLNDE